MTNTIGKISRNLLKQKSITYIANGSFIVPPGVTVIDLMGIGGGGGGGGGAANGASAGTNAAGGGGSKRARATVTVVPGETLTIVIGTGGTAGAAGTASADNATSGGHGVDTTVTGSISGLLITCYGAMGGVRGFYNPATNGFAQGGLPGKHSTTLTSDRQYLGDNAISTQANGYFGYAPGPGQGGHAPVGTVAIARNWQQGGSTGDALGGVASYVSTGSGAGGASEWQGGVGGAATLTGGGGTNGNVGGNGVLGSGGGGGTSTTGTHPGGNGGTGGDGALIVSWIE